MKCPICNEDHFELCHSCPHNGHVAGMAYEKSPCYFCSLDRKDRPRKNDSRENGHGRVVSLEQIERYVDGNISAPEPSGEDKDRSGDVLREFIRRFCSLSIRVQFMFEQREFFGLTLEEVAAEYRRVFSVSITAAGVSAAIAAAKSRLRLSVS